MSHDRPKAPTPGHKDRATDGDKLCGSVSPSLAPTTDVTADGWGAAELEKWRRWQALTPEAAAVICLFCLAYPADPDDGIGCLGCRSMGADSVNSPTDGGAA